MTEKRRERNKKKIPPPPKPKMGGTSSVAIRQMPTTLNPASHLESAPLARRVLQILECFPRVGQTLFRFDDGYEWVQDGENLSLRCCTPEEEGEHWSPKIRFTIVDGTLQSVEGPVQKKNHKHIIALLLHDAVQGINPDGTFCLDELDKDAVAELLSKKPSLRPSIDSEESGCLE